MSINKFKIAIKKYYVEIGITIAFTVFGVCLSLAILRTISEDYKYTILMAIDAFILGMCTSLIARIHTEKKVRLLLELLAIFVGSLLGTAINYGIIKNEMENQLQSDIEANSISDEKSGISTYDLDHTTLDSTEIADVVDTFKSKIDYVKNNNVYFEMMTDETNYSIYVTNKNGEIFEQTSDGNMTTIYKNDGESVRYYNDTLTTGIDIDVLSVMNNVLDAVNNNVKGTQMFEMKLTEKTESGNVVPENLHEYRVDLNGEEAVKAAYMSFGEEFAQSMLDNTKSQLGKDWEPHMIYVFRIDTDKDIISTYCDIVDVDNEEKVIWIIKSFLDFGIDWELPKKWYDKDYILSLNNADDINNIVDETVEIIAGLMDKYNEQQNTAISNNRVSEE